MKATDIITQNFGSIIRIEADSVRGRKWMHANIDPQEAWNGSTSLCEHRYGLDIIVGAITAGLRVRDVSGRLAALALLLFILSFSLCQAEPLIISQSAFVLVQAADLHSTHVALSNGRGVEANPIMGHELRRVTLKAGATAGMVWASNRIARTHPRLARVVLYASAIGIGTIAARNYQIGGTP